MQDIFKSVSTDQLRWNIVRLFIKYESQHEFLIFNLKVILKNKHELFDSKLTAAEYLMQLDNLDGLIYVSDIVLNDNDLGFDFRHRFNSISQIKKVEAIPILLKLLKVAKQSRFKEDQYHSLESVIFTSLYSIGIQSENSYLIVKDKLEDFIQENKGKIEHLNFIHSNIQKIEEQMYLNKSQSCKIEDAIEEFEKL